MDINFNPKEFLDIKWKEEVEDTGLFLSEEFLVKNSATYKILNDEFTKVWSSDSDDETKKNTKGNANKNTRKPVPNKGMKGEQWRTTYGGFTNFPKLSTLSIQEQEVYLSLMKKFTNCHSPFLSPLEQRDLQAYTTLQEKVVQEQIEYTRFLREYALANQSRYLSIPPGIRRYINELWESKLKIPLKYPQFYETFRTIPLVLQDKSYQIEFHPEECALEEGRVHIIKPTQECVNIATSYDKFLRVNPIRNADDESEPSLSKKYSVSQDNDADTIAKLKNAEFVISSSGLKRICDNHGPLFQKSWELPVTVKECDSQDGRKKTIIFIDKALPRKKMGVVDKIIWYHKVGIKSSLVFRNPRHTYRLETGHPPKNIKKMALRNKKNKTDATKTSEAETKEQADDSEREELTKSNTKETMGEIASDTNECEETMDESEVTDDDEKDSSDLPDSDEDNLVIEEDSYEPLSSIKAGKKPEHTSPKSKSDDVSPVNIILPTTPDRDSKIRVTRSVSKMLENLNKIEKLLGKKDTNPTGRSPVARNLMAGQNSETSEEAQCSSEEGKEKPKKEELPPKQLANDKQRKKPNLVGKDIIDELIENQKKMLEGNDALLELANSDKKFLGQKVKVDLDPSPPGSNYIYRPFILRRKDSSVGAFRTLVRCKYDAAEASKIKDNCAKQWKMVTICPKLEFQPEFGAEVVTLSELTRQWLCLLMKPESKLVRARINAFTSKMIMREEREMKDIAKEERRLGLQVSPCLSILYSVFRAIADIPPGQYILSHNAKLGAFVNLYRATDNPRNGCYDLHKQYEIDPTMEEPQTIANLWIPVDFGIITPFHERFNRVPGTFNPVETPKNKKRKKKKKTKKK